MKAQVKTKTRTIRINGTAFEVEEKKLSFEQILDLYYGGSPPSGPMVDFDITYKRGQGNDPLVQLGKNETLNVKDGMEIDVTPTDRS